MASLKERLSVRVQRLRARSPVVDHILVMLGHYGAVNGNAQAGAVTFFGFLSFFPILALAFFVIGILAHVYPGLKADMVTAFGQILPGVIGGGKGEIPLSTFESNAGAVGVIGLVGVLYSGLGWLSGLRSALEVMFQMPTRDQPNFIVGKLRDLTVLGVIGVTLILSVALSSAVSGFTKQILGLVGLDEGPVTGPVLWVIGHGLAVAATTVLFLAMFRLLAAPRIPRRALLEGAVVGAAGFEVLKMVSILLIAQTKGQAAFQAFGVALILIVWINYFTRIVMYSAAWAYTHPLAVEARASEHPPAPGAALTAQQNQGEGHTSSEPDPPALPSRTEAAVSGKAAAIAGAAAGGVVLGALALRRRHRG